MIQFSREDGSGKNIRLIMNIISQLHHGHFEKP